MDVELSADMSQCGLLHLDDIVVFSRFAGEHFDHAKYVSTLLRDAEPP